MTGTVLAHSIARSKMFPLKTSRGSCVRRYSDGMISSVSLGSLSVTSGEPMRSSAAHMPRVIGLTVYPPETFSGIGSSATIAFLGLLLLMV